MTLLMEVLRFRKPSRLYVIRIIWEGIEEAFAEKTRSCCERRSEVGIAHRDDSKLFVRQEHEEGGRNSLEEGPEDSYRPKTVLSHGTSISEIAYRRQANQ